jgi:hypothetical protein
MGHSAGFVYSPWAIAQDLVMGNGPQRQINYHITALHNSFSKSYHILYKDSNAEKNKSTNSSNQGL